MVEMGLFEDVPLVESPVTYREFTAQMLDVGVDCDFHAYLAELWGLCEDSKPITDLEWLGLFSDEALPTETQTPIDVIASRMESKLAYKRGERDLLVMQHEFEAVFEDHEEVITATLIDYGIPNGDTSMARTVGLPAAIAARMIIQGEVPGITGVHVPVIPELYEPILAELAELDIELNETTRIA
jgi:hypothetical protein